MDIIKSIEHEQLKNEIPVLKIGIGSITGIDCTLVESNPLLFIWLLFTIWIDSKLTG